MHNLTQKSENKKPKGILFFNSLKANTKLSKPCRSKGENKTIHAYAQYNDSASGE